MSLITLENNHLKATLNTYGGQLESLIDKHTMVDHVWKYNATIWPRRTALCFPFCGRSQDNKYTYAGQEYDIPNHGFARQREFSLLSCSANNLELQDHFDSTTLAIYPFKYNLVLSYHLEGASLVVKYHVTNQGDSIMYYSIGSHYAYQLPLLQSQCALWFSCPQHGGPLDLSNGSLQPDILKGRSCVPLLGLIDNASIIFDLQQLNTSWVGIGTKDQVFTKVRGDGFRYVLAWAPVGRDNPFTCIEFWDGMAHIGTYSNKIEEKFAVRTLNGGESRTYSQLISF